MQSKPYTIDCFSCVCTLTFWQQPLCCCTLSPCSNWSLNHLRTIVSTLDRPIRFDRQQSCCRVLWVASCLTVMVSVYCRFFCRRVVYEGCHSLVNGFGCCLLSCFWFASCWRLWYLSIVVLSFVESCSRRVVTLLSTVLVFVVFLDHASCWRLFPAITLTWVSLFVLFSLKYFVVTWW